MPHLLTGFATLSKGFRVSLIRFPLPCFFSVTLAAGLVLSIDSATEEDPILLRIGLLSALGFVLSLFILSSAMPDSNWIQTRSNP